MAEPELVTSEAGLAGAAVAGRGTVPDNRSVVRARGYWELVWIRFKRDRIAVASGIFIILLFVVAFAGAPIARHFVGHGPNDIFTGTQAVSTPGLLPANPWTWIDYLAPPTYTHTNHDISSSAPPTASARTSFCACSTALKFRSRWPCSRPSAWSRSE